MLGPICCGKRNLGILLQILVLNYMRRGNCLLQRGLSTTDLRCRQALLAEACDKFRTANSIDPNNFDTLYNWGNALLHRYYNHLTCRIGSIAHLTFNIKGPP